MQEYINSKTTCFKAPQSRPSSDGSVRHSTMMLIHTLEDAKAKATVLHIFEEADTTPPAAWGQAALQGVGNVRYTRWAMGYNHIY
jgi:hypothetical protein